MPRRHPMQLGVSWWLRTLIPLLTVGTLGWMGWQRYGPEAQESYYVGSQGLTDALEISAAYWGENPCGSKLVLRSGAVPEGAAASATPRTCTINFPPESADRSWGLVCSIVVHEYGHVVGLEHSSRPGSVMQPTVSEPIPQCRDDNPRQTLKRGQAWIRGGKRPLSLPVRVGWDRGRKYTLRVYEDNLYLRRTQRRNDWSLLNRTRGAQGGCGRSYRRISWQPVQQNDLDAVWASVAALKPRQRRVCAFRSSGRLLARARVR